jgi:ATP-dependent Lon protease
MFLGNPKTKDETRRRKVLPLLPLRDIIVFPYMVVPLFVGREKSIAALDEAMGKDREVILSAQKLAKVEDPGADDIFRLGTLGTIIQLLRLPDGTMKVLIEGKGRARIHDYVPSPTHFRVLAEEVPDEPAAAVETEALFRSVQETFDEYAKLNKRIAQDLVQTIAAITEPGRLADMIVPHLTLKMEDKQALLETFAVTERLERLFGLMRSEIEILQVEKKIKNRVRKQMERTQKEYYLNEKMRAIQKELGDRDDFRSDLKELEEKIVAKKMSKEATQKVKAEFKKLQMMSPMSAEATVVRNYIDTVLALPWTDKTEEKVELDDAERILEEDHYGLQKVKERIVEYLAVQALVGKLKGPILCLVGPPGVGKTSLGKSIARATGRKFVRLSLGGVRDEAEIRGHRRTYIGSMPGKILQALRKAGTQNPVMLLDEVDKMAMDYRGDPAAALLEVLDPEQNHAFNDHYLDLDYDLSDVMFITTANVQSQIPPPLLDRMEVIRLAGYTEDEQLAIARQFLVPKQMAANGLKEASVHFSDGAILHVIRRYTREAGVRNMEREIAAICRKVAREYVKEGVPEKGFRITEQNVAKYLGVPRFRYGQIEEEDRVGLVTGLAWTEAGGELLPCEVSVMPGKGKLTITGKLGEVMQESAQAAMSYVRTRAVALGLDPDFYQKVDIHVHVPEGAIPKDGPSAGITMATAIASALTHTPVRRLIAMTGEITLRGRVLPIGGLKEKLIAAHRGKVAKVLIPSENEKDLKEIPAPILKELELQLVENMDDVLRAAFAVSDPDAIFKGRADEPPREVFYEKSLAEETPPLT